MVPDRFAQNCAQFEGSERLSKDQCAFADRTFNHVSVSISRHEHNRHIWKTTAYPSPKLGTAHPWHCEINQDEVRL